MEPSRGACRFSTKCVCVPWYRTHLPGGIGHHQVAADKKLSDYQRVLNNEKPLVTKGNDKDAQKENRVEISADSFIKASRAMMEFLVTYNSYLFPFLQAQDNESIRRCLLVPRGVFPETDRSTQRRCHEKYPKARNIYFFSIVLFGARLAGTKLHS